MVDLMHQTLLVEMVIIIPHHILVLVALVLIMDLVEVVTNLAVMGVLLMQEVAVVDHLLPGLHPAITLVVMVEQVIKLHGFLLTYHLSSVNQDRHQECGTAVVEAVAQDQVVLADLVVDLVDLMLVVVLVQHLYQTMIQLQHCTLSLHQVLAELDPIILQQ